jgi:hypothetical protein
VLTRIGWRSLWEKKWNINGVCECGLPRHSRDTSQWKCHKCICEKKKKSCWEAHTISHQNWENPSQRSSKYFVAVSCIQTTTPKDNLSNCFVVSTMRLFKHKVRWTKESYFSGSHIWARDNPHRVNLSVSSYVVIVMDTVADLFLLKDCLLVVIFNFLQDVLPVLAEAVPLAVWNSLWCQRDGAPAIEVFRQWWNLRNYLATRRTLWLHLWYLALFQVDV